MGVVISPSAFAQFHTADTTEDTVIDLPEVLRVIQFYNANAYQCMGGTEDGYAPGAGSETCGAHDSDYDSADYVISLRELLRLVQMFSVGAYYACPGEVPPTEDGFCPGEEMLDVQLGVDPTAVVVPEGGTAGFSVALTEDPGEEVTVSVARVSGDTDLIVLSGGSLTFDSGNFDTPQTVTLVAGDDADTENGTATFRVSLAGATAVDVEAMEADGDAKQFVVSTPMISVPEGGMQTFTVALSADPGGPITATVARVAGDDDITVTGGASLDFDSGNFTTPQTVTLAAAEDDDAVEDAATIRLTATDYTDFDVTATEEENDALEFVLSATTVDVPEGGTASFTVALSADPVSPVTASVAQSVGDPDVTVVSGGTLNFETGNFSTPQTVTLAAAEDLDAEDGTATLTVSATGIPDAAVTATEQDNDVLMFVVSAATLAVPEGDTASFTVALSTAPASETEVTVAIPMGDSDLEVVSGGTLLFDAGNFSDAQTVEISAAEDLDLVSGVGVLSIDGDGIDQVTVELAEVDDDAGPRVSGMYTATPLSANVFDFRGPVTPDDCDTPPGLLTFMAGDSLARDRGSELEVDPLIVLPALQLDGAGAETETSITLQNMGDIASVGLLILMSDSEILEVKCSGELDPGEVWAFSEALGDSLPDDASQGIVYSIDLVETVDGTSVTEAEVCATIANFALGTLKRDPLALGRALQEKGGGAIFELGAPMVATCRLAPVGQPESAGVVSAAYSGFASLDTLQFKGGGSDPQVYAVPYVRTTSEGLDTRVHVENPASAFNNIALTFVDSGTGIETTQNFSLAPQDAMSVSASAVVGDDFLGSARVSTGGLARVGATVTGPTPVVAAYSGVNVADTWPTASIPVLYELGWEHGVAVQNLSETNATSVAVTYYASDGSPSASVNASIPAGRSDVFTFTPGTEEKGSASYPDAGFVIVESGSEDIAATLVSEVREGGFDAPVQLTATALLGPETIFFDPGDPALSGAKVLGFPAIGKVRAGEAIASELVIWNANPAAGETSYALYAYDAAGLHEYRCGSLAASTAEHVVVGFDELGAGFRGGFILRALESDQEAGPGLAATVLQRTQPVVADKTVTTRGAAQPDMTAASIPTLDTPYEASRIGPLVYLPVLNVAGGEDATPVVQFFEVDESNSVGMLYFDEDGELLTPIAPLIEEGNNLEVTTLSVAVPDRAVSAVVVGIDDSETDLIDAYNALDPTMPETGYPAFLETYIATVTEPADMVVSVTRETDSAPERLAVYEGVAGALIAMDDPVNGGFSYSVPQGYLASGGHDTTVYVQNAGTLPTQVEVSLRRSGEGSALISAAGWNPEGGDLSVRVGTIAPGSAKAVRLADVLPSGIEGRVVVRASEPLAVVAETSGSLAANVVPPATLNFTFDQGSAIASNGSRVVYAPLIPGAGFNTAVHLQNALDLGTATSATVIAEYYAADGALSDVSAIALPPFEGRTISIPGDFTPLAGPGWMKLIVNNSGASNPAELQGSVVVENPTTGDTFAYSLWPEYFYVAKGSFNEIEMYAGGISKNFGPEMRSSKITLLNPDLNPLAVDTDIQIRFYGSNGIVGDKGVAATIVDVTLSPGTSTTVDLADAVELIDGLRGGINIEVETPDVNAPAVMAVIEH
jgi:hypothetical protein